MRPCESAAEAATRRVPLVCSDLTFGLTVGDSSCYRWSSRPCVSWGVVHRSSGARTVDRGTTPHVARLGQDEGTPARREVAMNETPVFVGIDVAKATLEVAVRPSGAQWASANEEAGIQTLLGQLRALTPALVVLEATGGYEHAVAAPPATAGGPIVLAHPPPIPASARATGQLAQKGAVDPPVPAPVSAALGAPPRR